MASTAVYHAHRHMASGFKATVGDFSPGVIRVLCYYQAPYPYISQAHALTCVSCQFVSSDDISLNATADICKDTASPEAADDEQMVYK